VFVPSSVAPLVKIGEFFARILPDSHQGSFADVAFFTNAPLSLLGNEAYTGSLFTVSILSGAMDGAYWGDVQLVGGGDGNATDTLGTAQFSVSLATASAPEPGTLALLSLGALGVLVARRRCVG
jgi:PEP-CTERM motif